MSARALSALALPADRLGAAGPAAELLEAAGLTEATSAEVASVRPCRGDACTGARRTGRSPRDEPHCGAAPGVQGAAWPGPETGVEGFVANAPCPVLVGLVTGSVIGPASPPASRSEPPFNAVEANITADPANNAPRVRAVGLHELGDTGGEKPATIDEARSLLRLTNGPRRPITPMPATPYRASPSVGGIFGERHAINLRGPRGRPWRWAARWLAVPGGLPPHPRS